MSQPEAPSLLINCSLRDLGLLGYDTYTPGLGHRYGSKEMQRNWSQRTFWGNIRKVWTAVARAQHKAGLVPDEELNDLIVNEGNLAVKRILELERQTGHDVGGAIAELSEVAPLGGRVANRGMTSEDALSNAEMMQIRDGFAIIRPKMISTLGAFGERIAQYRDLVCNGYTHFKVAEPITMGYRFANHAQDLLTSLRFMDALLPLIKTKGIKGATGTSSSFTDILRGTGMTAKEHERMVMEELDLKPVTVSNQTYPRSALFTTTAILASIGLSLHKWALDLQLLQADFIDEVAEPRSKGRIDSTGMPFKTGNPINTENVCALTQVLPGILTSAWITGATVTFERTLRDSAGKRDWLPAGFFIIDESLGRAEKVMRGMMVHEDAVKANLDKHAPKLALGMVFSRLTRAGMDRKEAHRILLTHAEDTQIALRKGLANPIKRDILADANITNVLARRTIRETFEEIVHHVGDAPQRCLDFLERELYPAIQSSSS